MLQKDRLHVQRPWDNMTAWTIRRTITESPKSSTMLGRVDAQRIVDN